MKTALYFLLFVSASFIIQAQTPISSTVLPPDRMTDWTLAGKRFEHFGGNSQTVDIDAFGAIADGQTPCGTAFQNAINSVSNGDRIVLRFGTGTYFFNTPINLPENISIEGESADSTRLLFDLAGADQHCIKASGSLSSDTSRFVADVTLHDTSIVVFNPVAFSVGDYIYIKFDDTALMYSTWGYKTAGQIVRIKAINGNIFTLFSPLRRGLTVSQNPYIQRIIPKRNISISCLTIERQDQTATQTMNISLNYVVDSEVRAIESAYCNYAHIELSSCLNVSVLESYMHHGFDYGGGGKAYGTMLHFTTGECLIENNIFEHLRHSTITQAGANGNVFGYNYSFDPYGFQTLFYTDFVGDAVCHGNYPYLNLWEGNVVSFMSVDNSHGANGKYNTFFRNRATKYGIQVSNSSSSDQNFIGNEILGGVGLYSLAGTGHLEHGNNDKGTITPVGTDAFADVSLYRSTPPDFLPWSYFGGIGTPNAVSSQNNAAFDRENLYSSHWINTTCNDLSTPIAQLDSTQLNVIEGNTLSIPLYITYTNGQTGCTASLQPQSGSTALSGIDYSSPLPSISIAPNDNLAQSFSFVALEDTLLESTETVTLHLQSISGCVAGADSIVVVHILDNDVPNALANIDAQWITKMSPNPAQNFIQIESSLPLRFYRIVTIDGTSVLTSGVFSSVQPYRIEFFFFARGLYFIEVFTDSGLSRTLPLVVGH